MSRFLLSIFCSTTLLILLCSCNRPVPDGAYRVEVEKVSSHPALYTRTYSIETAGLRKFMLVEGSGANTVSIAPSIMDKKRTAKAEARVTVELLDSGPEARVVVKMEVQTESILAKAEETLSAPGTIDLSTILIENTPSVDLDSAKTLLRVASGKKYILILIE